MVRMISSRVMHSVMSDMMISIVWFIAVGVWVVLMRFFWLFLVFW